MSIRRFAAALVLGCSALLSMAAGAFTLGIDPSPLSAGETGSLGVSGTLSSTQQLFVRLTYSSADGGSLTPILPANEMDLIASGVANQGDGFALLNENSTNATGGVVDYTFVAGLAGPFAVSNDLFYLLGFSAGNPGTVDFVVEVCAVGDQTCDRTGTSTDPNFVPLQRLTGSLTINPQTTRVPEPGTVALLALVVIAAGIALRYTRR